MVKKGSGFQMTEKLALLNGYDNQNKNGQFWGGKMLRKERNLSYGNGIFFISQKNKLWRGFKWKSCLRTFILVWNIQIFMYFLKNEPKILYFFFGFQLFKGTLDISWDFYLEWMWRKGKDPAK